MSLNRCRNTIQRIPPRMVPLKNKGPPEDFIEPTWSLTGRGRRPMKSQMIDSLLTYRRCFYILISFWKWNFRTENENKRNWNQMGRNRRHKNGSRFELDSNGTWLGHDLVSIYHPILDSFIKINAVLVSPKMPLQSYLLYQRLYDFHFRW